MIIRHPQMSNPTSYYHKRALHSSLEEGDYSFQNFLFKNKNVSLHRMGKKYLKDQYFEA